jgi:hypothetical protein
VFNRRAVACSFVWRFTFLTADCPENEGVHNCGAVARFLRGGSPSSRFGSVSLTRGARPPCQRVGTLEYVGGDFARDALGHEWGDLPIKKGSISRAVTMLCSSHLHRALPPSGPTDGVRRCFLERSASGPPPPATSPLVGSRPWWCRRSCFLLAVV